jgi:hypothetical protein
MQMPLREPADRKKNVALRDPAAPTAGSVTVLLAKYPYPYRAMMAICSDLDDTPDRVVYVEIARFLNTRETTTMGPGVGLEAGNSIFFLMPAGQFSYFGTDDAGRDMVRALIRSGHIDCLHSYGDNARTRRDVERVLEEMDRHDCRLRVWVDHSKALTNFGPDIMVGSGDVTTSPAYHSDLTLRHGIRYVWRGRTTSIVGQNARLTAASVIRILDRRHPLGSTRTMLKQFAKIWLGALGSTQWEMHALNRVCRPASLRDGQRVWEFLRSNPFWAGPGLGDAPDEIGAVLTPRMLETLVATEGVCLLYTHLGKVRDPKYAFPEPTRAALRRLAAMQDAGQLRVTTTLRLLRYLTIRDCLQFTAARTPDGHVAISIGAVEDPVAGAFMPSAGDLMGVTFIVDRCAEVVILLRSGQPVHCDVVHRGESTIASVPWSPLVFPNLQ